ncbi:MAG: ABC transporter ATP-binding protein [Gemmatimonadaceae bacterium]|nr:ABC transporter ATP-binding protein [Gemmatimonadaceae bacterium]
MEVAARGLDKRFSNGVEALRGVDLAVGDGRFASIVGPSGCGKSTLLRLVAGLEEPSGGSLAVDGRARGARGAGPDLGFVFQEPTLLPWRPVARNVGLPLELRRSPDPGRVGELLDLVGLSEFADAFPAQLSGGMRMRASIARALATRPRLLLLDEPFGALDEITRRRLNEELLHLWQEDGWTGLFVTHNVPEAIFLGQQVLVMSARPGRILAEFDVPFPYPRDPLLRTAPEFIRLAGEVSGRLAEAGA